jgi:hypothetical protein
VIFAWPDFDDPLVVVRFGVDGSVGVSTMEEVPLLYRSVAMVTAFQQFMWGRDEAD